MKKILWVFLCLSYVSMLRADILECTFDQTMTSEGDGSSAKLVPLLRGGVAYQKHMTINLREMSNKVIVARGDFFPLNLEIYMVPMENRGSSSEWFYFVDFSQSLSLIQLSKTKSKRDTIIFYRNGIYPIPALTPKDLPTNQIYLGHCK